MRKSIISITENNGQISATVQGQLSAPEVIFAMEALKASLVKQGIRDSGIRIPGMLTPELTRLPADVAKRLVS